LLWGLFWVLFSSTRVLLEGDNIYMVRWQKTYGL